MNLYMHARFEDERVPFCYAFTRFPTSGSQKGKKKYIIFILRFIYRFPVPRGSQHCHIPVLTFLYLLLHARARAGDTPCIRHDRRGPFCMDIRVYRDVEGRPFEGDT